MDDAIIPACEKLVIKPACERCGQPYLKGSPTTCSTCLRRMQDPAQKCRQERLRCDCGEVAVAVIYVRIRIGGLLSHEPLAVCRECMSIEMETLRDFL